MKIEAKIAELGLKLPEAPKPVAAYIPALRSGNLVYTSGQVPFVNGELKYQGKVGGQLSPEEGYEAARTCALNCLAVIKGVLGDLDRVKRVVKVVGFVASAPGFNGQPKVVNGASELLGQIFGQAGGHARSAVGVSELPLDSAVEVEMIVEVED
ncbi:MAG: RidA family protein [Actinobacteria bacterium]|nr:RidA family protein [Actinomycetota bacterium]